MTTAFIHLSDLHYRSNRAESHGVLLNALFADLEAQLKPLSNAKCYLVFSGDIVQEGAERSQYSDFIQRFDPALMKLGIPKEQRICVPGNHDVSRLSILEEGVVHEGVIAQKLNEQSFNDFVRKQPNTLTKKFSNYLDFEARFAGLGVTGANITGAGWDLDDEIGVFCLNSALCSSGGINGIDGQPIKDMQRLAVDTRGLHEWAAASKSKLKVLVMHHPLSWLTEWSRNEIKTLLSNNFALCFSGHDHDQSALHSVGPHRSLTECSAPALFTKKHEALGYAIVAFRNDTGPESITYRQWTKFQTFRPGVSFSDTENGVVPITLRETPVTDGDSREDGGFIDRFLTQRLDKALTFFGSHPQVWVPPRLSRNAETVRDVASVGEFELKDLIVQPRSTLVIAPPQFGLTCTAHHMIREAWRNKNGGCWLYLDAKALKPNSNSINQAATAEMEVFGRSMPEVKCVVLDSWSTQDKDAHKLLQKVCELFKDTPLICMQTTERDRFVTQSDEIPVGRDFERLFLWSLTRSGVRKIVANYNAVRQIGEEDAVTTRIVADLTTLNLHRTPSNCLTLLKVSEVDFDESPVNRSEMIKRVLFLLFNMDAVPTYKVRPDLKDCEYVLGYFCETMLKESNYVFSREHFLNVLTKHCRERLIDLEVQVVFDVLFANNILVTRDGLFAFRMAYWVYYFAAQRMRHDEAFAAYIFQDMRYAAYPEIIEFYTGIDRQRSDALEVLLDDLTKSCDEVQTKCGFPEDMNPYRFAEWKASPLLVEKMQIELNEGVRESNLPAEIKDQYVDRHYDRVRPYDQSVRRVLAEFSLVYLMGVMKASAKALRNSDYAEPAIKQKLLRQILRSWDISSKVLLVLLPVLARDQTAVFDGCAFVLTGNFGDTVEKRFRSTLGVIPFNVVSWCEEDLFSQKMGPLLIDGLAHESSEISRHELILLLIHQRPRGWKTQVQSYIASVAKNSFYLYDVHMALRGQYRFAYATTQTLKDIAFLIQMAITKHLTGHKHPGVKLIAKTTARIINRDVIPPRDVS